MTSTVTSVDGTPIAYSKVGTGEPLILIDGATGYRAFNQSFQRVAELLSDERTVYTYDRRGRGESGDEHGFAGPPETAVVAELADLAALVEHAGGRATLLGISSGAVLALTAAMSGIPVDGVVLYEPPFVVDASRPPLAADYRDRLIAAAEGGRPGAAFGLFMTEAVGVPAEYVESMEREPVWQLMTEVAPTLAYDAAFMGDTMSGDPATLAKFAAVTAPALVLSGGDTMPFIAAGAAAVAAVLPNAELAELPGQSHDVAPEALAEAVRGWLKSR